MSIHVREELSDEALHLLYSSRLFQSFSEKDQQAFLERYGKHETFQEMINVAIGLNEVVKEVESYVPALTDEVKDYFKKPNISIVNRIKVENNLYYYPFGENVKHQGPLIICLQQGETMEEFSVFCKGLMLPLFDMCYREKRDLIVIPFAESNHDISFVFGQPLWDEFDQFLDCDLKGEAHLIPALKKAIVKIDEADVKEQIELIVFSNHLLSDYDKDHYEQLAKELKSRGVTFAGIAMSETLFREQPLYFFDKIYFVQE